MPPYLRVFSTGSAVIIEADGRHVLAPSGVSMDRIFASEDPWSVTVSAYSSGAATPPPPVNDLRAPLGNQEIWAAGVTYLRSKAARMEESKDAGGGTFYDKVYEADRPELFFKATPHRVAGPGGVVRIRRDSQWNVPEPEVTLAINSRGSIFGYTIGNDMSSRDIEGENPLYLPQAKVYDKSASIGPCLVVTPTLPGPDTAIRLQIFRGGAEVFVGETTVGRIKRPLPSLAEWLYRENSFPHGSYLMTGTGIVPPDTFTLLPADEIRITIEPVGALINTVA